MIRFLRYISVCSWITGVSCIPFLFIFLPFLNNFFEINPVILAIIIIIIIFFLTGYIINFLGEKKIYKFIKQAEAWARKGFYKKSEGNYLYALRIYDSFLISPLKNKKLTKKLTGSMANFFLVYLKQNKVFDKAVTAFLHISPDQEDIVFLWLKKICNIKHQDFIEYDLLIVLAKIHFKNPKIAKPLANILIQLKSTDFAARKLYKTVQKNLPHTSKTYLKIKNLLNDENIIAPNLSDLKNNTKKSLSNVIDITPKTSIIKNFAIKTGTAKLKAYLLKIINFIIIIFQFLIFLIKNLFLKLKEKQKIQKFIKFGFLILVGTVVLFFIFNILSNVFNDKIKNKNKIKIQNNDKFKTQNKNIFTIQIAAYLKKEYAQNHINKLKIKNLNAYLFEAPGGGKTWYLVRISNFSDKKMAFQYGEKLKKQGVINDFFVDNSVGD
ncbi:MAG: hypothetical protein B6I26_01165 [Desulfobacteraceae bacterium 4572_130]|nr:MAG: hypothetical protein B6I26_01165 [Desulfobacteraceae bacterium 4572_130]